MTLLVNALQVYENVYKRIHLHWQERSYVKYHNGSHHICKFPDLISDIILFRIKTESKDGLSARTLCRYLYTL